MKKTLALILFGLLVVTASSFAQVFRKADPIICPVDPNSYDTFVPPSEKFLNRNLQRSSRQSNIVVNYNGFTPQAQAAYQYAVDIWASVIKSPVTINVTANFTPLGQGVLGSAGPTNFVRDFEGAPFDTTFYPIALAEKISGKELNSPEDADINSNFNSDFDFYFGTDGNPPEGQYDFVSIVLHELGHGLGFSGVVTYQEPNGSWSVGNTGKTSIYTQFVILGDGTPIQDLADNSDETGDALTGDSLFFNGPISVNKLTEEPKLYAPASWSGGSSYSHLDEEEYPAGDPNSLMSPQFGAGEAIHNPGITEQIFADMGWIHTYLEHTNNNEITENVTTDFNINLSVFSDTTFNEKAPVLIYSTDNFATTSSVIMTDTGNGEDFTANIPNPGATSTIKYYFEGVQDGTGRDYTAPGNAPISFYTINILGLQEKVLPYTLADGGDFETNPSDWQAIVLAGNESIWEYGEPTNLLDSAPSGANVWKTKLNENIGNNGISVSAALVSPIFDFTPTDQNIELSFDFMMANAFTENDFFNQGPFGLQMEFSLDRGETWNLLGEKDDPRAENWYNVEENSPTVFPLTANAGWIEQTIEINDGDTTLLPITAKYNVSFLGGNPTVNFRLVFYAMQDYPEAGYEADGVLVDNFQVINSAPTADFISNSDGLIYIGDEVSFEYISAGADSYSWDFGDGNTSDLKNPTHAYTEGGSYDVSLTISSNAGNDTITKQNFIKVIPIRSVPYALEDGGNLEQAELDFSILNVSGSAFELGQSTIEGKQGTASGDFAFVIAPNDSAYENNSEAYIYTPEFNFESLGAYEFSFETNYQFEDNWDGFIVEYTLDRGENWVKLNNEEAEGWYNQISDPQSVFGNQVPIFSGNTGNEFERKFTDVSFLGAEGIVSFRIKFLTDGFTTDIGMAIDNFEITGPAAGPAVPNFSADVLSGCEDLTVVFTNESAGSITSITWDFGEGAEPRTANGIGPHEVVYAEAGLYDVSVTVQDLIGPALTEEKLDYIEVGASHTPAITAGERSDDFTVILTASKGDTYQWFMNGDTITQATEQTYLAVEDAEYSVAVVINSCVGFSDQNNIITSNDSPLAKSFSVFPNPLKNNKELNISFENQYLGEYSIEVYSLNGRRILSEKFNKTSQEERQNIKFNAVTEGLYLMRVTTGNQSTQIKVLIE